MPTDCAQHVGASLTPAAQIPRKIRIRVEKKFFSLISPAAPEKEEFNCSFYYYYFVCELETHITIARLQKKVLHLNPIYLEMLPRMFYVDFFSQVDLLCPPIESHAWNCIRSIH